MTFKQKAALITDISLTEDAKYTRLGIPSVRIRELEPELAVGQDSISIEELARSFDESGIEELVFTILSLSGDATSTVYTLPAPKPCMLGSFPSSVSEDACLSAQVLRAVARGVRRAGGTVMLDGFWLTQLEADSLDLNPDTRVIKECIVAPFAWTLDGGEIDALALSSARLKGEYENINRRLLTEESGRIASGGVTRLAYARTVDETLLALTSGVLLIKGVVSAVENAHIKYERMKAAVDSGQYTAYALEEAVSGGEALSDELVDGLLDTLLSLIFDCAGRQAEVIDDHDAARVRMRTMLARSAVLLKNERGRLPLKRGGKIAVIGDGANLDDGIFLAALRRGLDSAEVTFARGYDINEQRGSTYYDEACRAADEADSVLLFLTDKGLGKGFGRTLAANQIALLERLCEHKDKITVVLSTKEGVDMSFDAFADAIILHTVSGPESAEALCELLLGKRSPSGRLSKTLYYRHDEYKTDIKKHKERGYTRVGVFMDYKLYGDDASVGYVFGYGLSYGDVSMSDLTTEKGSCTLTVTNESESELDFAVQIYFGKEDSAIARPVRELKGVRLVHLGAGQSERVTVEHAPLDVYDSATNNMFVENGEHTVYACASVQDVRLTAKQYYNGWRLSHSNAAISDFLQNKSNITDKNFYLDARSASMRIYKQTQILAIAAFASAAALAIGAILMASLGIGFTVLMAILALSAAGGGAYMQLRALKQKRFYISEKSDATPLLFDDSKVARVISVSELFDGEFEAREEGAAELDTDVEHAIRILRDLSLDELCVFRDYAKERGVELDSEDASSFVSAFLTSRLLISRGLATEKLTALVGVAAEFLDATVSSDTVDENYSLERRLIAPIGEGEDERLGVVAEAVEKALAEPDRAHFVLLCGLDAKRMAAVLTPFVRYFTAPGSQLTVSTEDKQYSVTLPENLWFVCEMSNEESPDAVPHYLNESATLLTAEDLIIKERAPEFLIESDIVYGTLEPLAKRLAASLPENEELFKKIDRLEEYVSQRTPYSIGNRFWLRIESYLSTLIAMGIELRRAIDLTLATVILPTLASVVRGKLLDDERTLVEETERVFGEDGTEAVRKLLA